MGIPALFSTLIKKYNIPQNNKIIIKKNICLEKKINFHLDFNSVLYLCLKPEIQSEEVLIIHILQYLDKLVSMLNSNIQLLHICLDGVSVEFKQIQMRNRRMHSIISKHKTNDINTRYGDTSKELFHNSTFDTNRFSPGTAFMHTLSSELKTHIASTELYQTISQIIISDTLVPGEGEIKILHYIKANPTDITTNTIIYALDADVIIQSLINGCNQIYLLRESGNFGYLGNYYDGVNFLYLDIDSLKIVFLQDIAEQMQMTLDDIIIPVFDNGMRFIYDLCFLFFMLGNDFIPKIHHISIHNNGIHYLTSAYISAIFQSKTKSSKNGIDFLVDKTELNINTQLFCKILAILTSKEDLYLSKFFEKRMRERIPIKEEMTERERQIALYNFTPLLNLENEKFIDPPKYGWENRYYKLAFGFPADEKNINNVVHNYLKSLVWNFQYYYSNTCPSWEFYYPYSYGPPLKHIFSVLATISNINTRYKFVIGEPVLPQVLLLKVLPISSKSFLIKSIRDHLFNSIEFSLEQNASTDTNLAFLINKLKKYFPTKYSINLLYNRYIHECVPIIPYFDTNTANEILSKFELTEEEQTRNIVGNIWIYNPTSI